MTVRRRRSFYDRFLGQVETEPNTGCWLWVGASHPFGYGFFCFGSSQDPKRDRMLAHRASYILFRHQDPHGYCVLHACDNPPCVNPDHLRLGSQQENVEDMRRKWRGRNSKKGLPFGVSYMHPGGRPRATIKVNGTQIHLGTFNSVTEAHLAAVAAKTASMNPGAESR